MNSIMNDTVFVIVSLIALCLLLVSMLLTNWVAHIHMVKRSTKQYDFVTFKRFYKEFSKYKYDNNLEVEQDSIFVRGNSIINTVTIHADIIAFGENGMILYPWSLVKFWIWKKRFIKEYNDDTRPKRVKNLWGK